METLATGTVVAGRYAVQRVLGRGATKQVYLADDRLTGTAVALALLVADQASDPTLAARFSREGKAASVLRSPYVVRVFDAGKLADGTRYLATEPVLGRGLDVALANGAVPPEHAARWTAHVLAALTEAHGRGILHRDVKPENVLLAPASDGGENAKLADFGLAKVLDGALEGSFNLRTAQNIVLGTPEYMAPEQWNGGRIDARTDVYATGVMLYELLMGRPPFESKFLHAICVAHMTQQPPSFGPEASAAARALEPVVMRALAKESVDRFESAEAMRAALEAVSGYRLPEGLSRAPEAPRCARAELLSDAWNGVLSMIATPNVVLGRDAAGANIVVRCLPTNEENDLRNRTVSRQHARIDWRGGRAFVTDMESRTGTRIGDRAVRGEPTEIRDGETLSLGKHVQLQFAHAPAAQGELPKWARLSRVDAFGGGQVFVLVLTEAKISSGPDAAVRLPASVAAGDMLRFRAHDAGLVVLPLGAIEPIALHDAQRLRLGGVQITVAVGG